MKLKLNKFQIMLDGLGLTFEGRQHSGIDDSANIVRIMKELALLGHVFDNTTSNSWKHDLQKSKQKYVNELQQAGSE